MPWVTVYVFLAVAGLAAVARASPRFRCGRMPLPRASVAASTLRCISATPFGDVLAVLALRVFAETRALAREVGASAEEIARAAGDLEQAAGTLRRHPGTGRTPWAGLSKSGAVRRPVRGAGNCATATDGPRPTDRTCGGALSSGRTGPAHFGEE